MGKGRVIAETMNGFAQGVYRQMDSKAAGKAIKGSMSKTVDFKSAKAGYRSMSKTGAYKFGQNVANSAPMSGITGTARAMTSAKNAGGSIGFGQALKQGHSKALLDENGKQVFKNGVAQTRLSKAKVAGTVATVGVAGRVASGGGLYRDRYGNVNLPGVPFI